MSFCDKRALFCEKEKARRWCLAFSCEESRNYASLVLPLSLKLLIGVVKCCFVEEDVGVGGKAEVEEGEEGAELVMPFGGVPTDDEKDGGIGRKAMLEEVFGGGEAVAIKEVEEHVWLYISTWELCIEAFQRGKVAVSYAKAVVQPCNFEDVEVLCCHHIFSCLLRFNICFIVYHVPVVVIEIEGSGLEECGLVVGKVGCVRDGGSDILLLVFQYFSFQNLNLQELCQ